MLLKLSLKPRQLTLCACFGLALLLLATQNPAIAAFDKTSSKSIKVGCLFPFTEPGGLYGRDSAVAINMALDELRASSEVSYPTIEVIVGDTRSKLLRAVQLTSTFIEDEKVDFLCGVVSSKIALAVTEIARQNKVIFVGTDHASPQLINEALHPYYFRVNNGTRQSMFAAAIYLKNNYQNHKDLKIAFIGPDYDYGYQAWSDLRYFLQQQNVKFEIVGEYWPKLYEGDYSTYIHALNADQPDIVVNGHWGQDLVTFIKQAKPLGLFEQSTLMNFDAGGNYETLAELGGDMPLGIVLSARHHVNWPATAANKSFVQQFHQRTGRYPSYAAEGAYSGIKAIAEVVRRTPDLSDTKQLLHQFENLVIKLPEDPDGFSSRMDPHSHQMLQAQAIGKTIPSSEFPPAKVLLGDWFVHYPAKHLPSVFETP